MPNYCYNSISFDGPDGALEELLASSDSDVDFERVIPMPASLDEANTTGASERLAVMAWLMHGMDEPTVERIKDAHGDEWEMYASQMPSFMTKDDRAAEMVTDAKTKLEAMPPEQYADVYALGARVIDNLRLHGHASWYGWRIDNWGTKWNAMDVEGDDGDLPGIADMKWKHCELVRDENGGVAHVRPCEPDAFEVPSVLR